MFPDWLPAGRVAFSLKFRVWLISIKPLTINLTRRGGQNPMGIYKGTIRKMCQDSSLLVCG